MIDSKQVTFLPRTDCSNSFGRQEQGPSLRHVALHELRVKSLPRRRIAAGSMIMHPEEQIDSLYFILDGRVRLYRLAPNGEEVFQGELGPDDCLKCPRVLCKHDCHSFAEAVVDTTVEVLSRPLFERLVHEW